MICVCWTSNFERTEKDDHISRFELCLCQACDFEIYQTASVKKNPKMKLGEVAIGNSML